MWARSLALFHSNPTRITPKGRTNGTSYRDQTSDFFLQAKNKPNLSRSIQRYVQKCRLWWKWQFWRNFLDDFDEFGKICESDLWRFGRWNFAKVVNRYDVARRARKSWRKRRIWQKWRFWQNFAKVFDEMIRVNKLTLLKGPQKVREFGEKAKTTNLSKVTILTKVRQGCWRNDNNESMNPATSYRRVRKSWQKWRFLRNFAKVVDEIIKVSKLTQLEGPPKSWQIWRKRRIWQSRDSDEISPRLLTKW